MVNTKKTAAGMTIKSPSGLSNLNCSTFEITDKNKPIARNNFVFFCHVHLFILVVPLSKRLAHHSKT